MLKRICAMAVAAAALAGCASGSGGGYGAYDDGPYPYYGGGFGSYYDDGGYDRYYEPARGVRCDRGRDICYDRYGPSYFATARYLGDREANRAFKKYGDSVFLFSPRSGVSCDRRTRECSDGAWPDHAVRDPLKRLEKGNMGSIGAGSGFEDDDVLARPAVPTRRSSEGDGITKRIEPRTQAPLAGDADNDATPLRRIQPQRPTSRPMLNSGDKPGNGGGNACPPRGCRD